MSVYATTFRVANTINVPQLEAELEDKLASKLTTEESLTLVNTASTTLADLVTKNITAEVDDLILAECQIEYSASTTTHYGQFIMYINGVVAGIAATEYDAKTSTGGATQSIVVIGSAVDLTGTIAVAVKWKTENASTTIYSAQRRLQIMQTKRR